MSDNEEALSCIADLYREGDSSTQLEITHWRDVLKAEIEQDIEEQVRRKLGFTSFIQYDPIAHGTNVGSTTLFKRSFSTRTCLPPLLQSQQQHNIRDINVTHHLEGQNQETASHLLNKSSDIKTQRVVSYVKRSSSRRKLDNSRTNAREVLSPEVIKYVTSKYGTPIKQMENLQQIGQFSSMQFDCSGDKTGPLIHCPLEANIFVPTPKHMKTVCCLEQNDCTPSIQPSSTRSSEYLGLGSESTENSEREMVFDKTQHVPPELSLSASTNSTQEFYDLMFESRFESGNLQQVIKISRNEYELKLCPDLYSDKHTQWFYFRVEGMLANLNYTFHITNFKKPDSLYNYGMKVLLYSEKEVEQSRDGWKRVGTNIRYHRCHGDSQEYTLSWTMEFPHTEDKCYMCYCYPYHYSQLLCHLTELEQCPMRSRYLKRDVLCKTLAGNTCPLLTITDFQCSPEELGSRPAMMVSARVHPGESNSSWMMEGLIQFLTSEANHAKNLRNQFVFLLVPMLNPDGVIVGNYRTSLAGVDLNRVYKNPLIHLFPTVYHTKMLMASTMQQRKLLVYVDLHGHSRKHNVFMYGCHVPKCNHMQFLNERVIPFLLSQQVPNMFSFESCKFNVHRCKESTGRVVTWKMGVNNSFTMEATFCGSTLHGHTKLHFHQQDLLAMGHGLGEALYLYHHFLKSKSYQQKILSQLAEHLMCSKGHDHGTEQEPLPDIITSATTCQAVDKMHMAAKSKRHRNTKSLRKFMRCNMDILEEESSTSGSDSENDEFTLRRKKAIHKKKHSTVGMHAQTQVHLPRLVRGQQQQHMTSQRVGSHTRLQCLQLPKPTASAPAKLVTTTESTREQTRRRQLVAGASKQQLGWRFINRYRDRSNGGIPMFSEERNRERKEKKLQALEELIASPHQESKNTSTLGHKGHDFWKPINTGTHAYGQEGNRLLEVKGYHGYSSEGYQSSALHLSNTSGASDMKEILESWKRVKSGPYQCRQISPRLAKFISEMWSSINDQQN